MTDTVTPAAIADLIRANVLTLQEAADMIQSYAEAYASGEVIKALEQSHARTMAILDAPLTRPLEPNFTPEPLNPTNHPD